MYRKIVWCYVFILTLLDISLNTKLSAQGKSHGVTVHDSLIEGITFQEWGKDPPEGEEGGGRRAALALSPPALSFGAAPLAAARARSVTLTNTANTTIHLASVAGTTPDFHASFFHTKTLPPQANTTFSVVYLGRREGPVSAHLYIHTSLGVHKYPVSAVGVASEWGVWPLVGLRVPENATAEPLLTMYNPTDESVQVTEVYSSAPWLRLSLADGAERAPRARWLLPPRTARPLVRLRLQPPSQRHAPAAYIRIKAGMPGGGLLVAVEAARAPAGEFLAPLQLRLRAAGHLDPPLLMDIEAGNSLDGAVPLEASVWRASCGAAPPHPPHPLDQPARSAANGNGVKSEGVHVSLLRSRLEPLQSLERTAQLTLDYAAMWSAYTERGDADSASDEAWCAGWVRLGRAALPYSVRLLRGTLRAMPRELHWVTATLEQALEQRELRVRNEFASPVHVSHVERPADVDEHFECEWLTPLVVPSGAEATVARLRLRPSSAQSTLNATLVLRTNVTHYAVPVYVYTGLLELEWEWWNSADGWLRLGGVGASSTRRVRLRARNAAPARRCVRAARAALPGAQLALAACAHLRSVPPHHACRCIDPGESAEAWLTVVAPAREGALRGEVVLETAPAAGAGAGEQGAGAGGAATRAGVALTAHRGRVLAPPLQLHRVAPYVESRAALVLESSMSARMRVEHVAQPTQLRDPALTYIEPAEAEASEVSAGRQSVGTVAYHAERNCGTDCYTGLDIESTEGAAWLRRSAASSASLAADAALAAARRGAYTLAAARARNVSLYVHTTQVVQIPVSGTVSWWWPTLVAEGEREPGGGGGGGGEAGGVCGVGETAPRRVRARNPARVPLLLQPVIGGPLAGWGGVCAGCVERPAAFRLAAWRAARGSVRLWEDGDQMNGEKVYNSSGGALPLLLLSPGAEVDFHLVFAPSEPRALAAVLYLRNNLTIMEGVELSGRGVYPSFELAGRKPNSNSPILFEVSSCWAGGGALRRAVVARNTGLVALRLRGWAVGGAACGARGFRLQPCSALTLQPNESRALTLHFEPDPALARVHAQLTARDHGARAAFPLLALTPARLLRHCAASAPRPPWEPALRAAGTLLALAALALVLAAAALDAERELRRARAARPVPAPRPPLDLRALAHAPPAAHAPPLRRAPPPPRRRRPHKRALPPFDPHAERQAFERWRAEMLQHADEDDSRSSEDADQDAEPPAGPPTTDAGPAPLLPAAELDGAEQAHTNDGYEADPETEDRPPGSGDEDGGSTGSGTATGSSSSSPTAEHELDRDIDEPAPHVAPVPARPAPLDPAPDAVAAPEGRSGRPRDAPRRAERARTEEHAARPRAAAAKHHARKDKLAKRRDRPPPDPPTTPTTTTEARGGGVGGSLRWGASWSSVVAQSGRAAPLAPIGSDVRRRSPPAAPTPPVPAAPCPPVPAAPPAPRAAGDHSLFYFNGDAAHAHVREDFTWRPERPAYTTPYLEESNAVGNGSFRSVGSVWGSSLEPAPWLWGGAAAGSGAGAGAAAPGEVRPPPGFAAPARPARVYDPFRSLAAIWAPGARDWGQDREQDNNN